MTTDTAPKPEPRQLRLAAERLRQVAKASHLAVDKVPGAALFLGGDAEALQAVAAWLDGEAGGKQL
jgi:hypothetical protein